MRAAVQIYLLRHGKAHPAPSGGSDRERRLTVDGRRGVRAVVEQAKTAGLCPGVILTSPYDRALETAREAASVLGSTRELIATNALTPDSSPTAVWEEVRAVVAEPEVLLVGHEPLISALAAFLLAAPELQIDFRPASLARIDIDRVVPLPRGVLRWLMAP